MNNSKQMNTAHKVIQESSLSAPCFLVEDGKIKEYKLSDFSCYIETVNGRPKYYAKQISKTTEAQSGDDGEIIENESEVMVWTLAEMTTWSGPETIIREFESEEAANEAAEQTYIHDILNNWEQCIYLDRSGAEKHLRNLSEDE